MLVTLEVTTRSYSLNDGDDPSVEWGNRDTEVTEIVGVRAYAARADAKETDTGHCGNYGTFTRDLDVSQGDLIHAVIAVYSTGDTFGRQEGETTIMDLFVSLDEAQALIKGLQAEPKQNARISEFDRTVNGRKYWLPWVGYFEHLDNLSVHGVVVGQHPTAGVRYW